MQRPPPAGKLLGLSPLLSLPLVSLLRHLSRSTGIAYVFANKQWEAGAALFLSAPTLDTQQSLS